MELRFMGGSPIEAYVFIDSLDDIDIADVLFIINCPTIIAFRNRMKSWTEKTQKHFFDKMKRDIVFDMPNSGIYLLDPAAAIGDREVELTVDVDEDDIDILMFSYMPPLLVRQFSA